MKLLLTIWILLAPLTIRAQVDNRPLVWAPQSLAGKTIQCMFSYATKDIEIGTYRLQLRDNDYTFTSLRTGEQFEGPYTYEIEIIYGRITLRTVTGETLLSFTIWFDTPGSGEIQYEFEMPDGQSGFIYIGYATLLDSRLLNISTRGEVGIDEKRLIAGFVVDGPSTRRVLIRAAGPALASLGVSDNLADPFLQLLDANGKVIAANDNWSGTDTITAFEKAGAFAFPTNSRDSALVVTLSPGAYTAQVSGIGDSTGVALVEVYELPEG